MSEERLSSELAALEATLAGLAPAPSGIDRDRLMFLAGQAAGRRASAFGVRRFIAAFRRANPTAAQCSYTEEKAAMNHRTPKMLWPIATAASLLVAACFGVLWGAGRDVKSVEPPIVVSAPGLPPVVDPAADTSPPSPWANRRLCLAVLEKGIAGMPESPIGASYPDHPVPPPPQNDSYRGLLNEFLNTPTS
jgi:hypothetical protein